MNQRENFYAMVEGKKPEFAPIYTDMYFPCNAVDDIVEHPRRGGKDMFGVNWVLTKDGAMPDNKPMFEEIGEWRQYVKMPDLDTIDFKGLAEQELSRVNREERIINVNTFVGLFERMVSLMGFENTFVSLVEDPEGCMDFFEEFTRFKVDFIHRLIDAYHPDVVTYFDDIASARSLFFSVDTYRELYKPYQKRIIEAIREKGVIASDHCCGKCEAVIPDFVEIGIQIWNSAQHLNDLPKLMAKYKGKLMFEGGWNGSGRCACVDATLDEIMEEADRCLDQYAGFGNFALFPIIMNERGNAIFVGDERLDKMVAHWHEHARL